MKTTKIQTKTEQIGTHLQIQLDEIDLLIIRIRNENDHGDHDELLENLDEARAKIWKAVAAMADIDNELIDELTPHQ